MSGNRLFFAVTILVLSSAAFSASDPVDDSKLRAAALKIYASLEEPRNIDSYRAYLNAEAFNQIDADKDGVLQYVEYRDARLYCRPTQPGTNAWRCKLPLADDDRYKGLTQGQNLTASVLYERDTVFWAPVIDQQAAIYWGRGSIPTGNTLTVDHLVEILRANNALAGATGATRLQDNLAEYRNASSNVHLDTFTKDVVLAGLLSADKNVSGSIDVLEFLKAFDHPNAVSEFNALIAEVDPANPQLLTHPELLTNDLVPKHAPYTSAQVQWQLNDIVTFVMDRSDSESLPLSAVSEGVAAVVEQEADARQRKTVNLGPFGSAYVKSRGLVFPSSDAQYNAETKAVEIKDGTSPVVVRVIQDFTKAGANATAASLSWSKDAGSSPNPDINVSVRADWYRKAWDRLDKSYRFRPAFGIHYARSGRGDEKLDRRKLFLLGDIYLGGGSKFLLANHIQFGPVWEKDQVERVDKVTGLLEWEPVLNLFGHATGSYWPVTDNVSWYVRPRLAIELNDIRDQPTGGTVTDSNFYRYGLEIGWRFGERTTLTYDYRQRHATDDTDEDYHYQFAQLEWQLDREGIYKLTLGAKQGRDTPDFKRVEQYSVGLGVKF